MNQDLQKRLNVLKNPFPEATQCRVNDKILRYIGCVSEIVLYNRRYGMFEIL